MKKFWKGLVTALAVPFLVGTLTIGVQAREPDLNPDISGLNDTNWMSGISGDRLLTEINIPGAHDAATHNVTSKYASPLVKAIGEIYAIAQFETIPNLLNSGVRLLDYRFADVSERDERKGDHTILMLHGAMHEEILGCDASTIYAALDDNNNEIGFDTAMKYATDFLDAHPTETVLVQIGRETESKDNDSCYNQINAGLKKLATVVPAGRTKPYLYMPADVDKDGHYTRIPTLKEVRGQIFLIDTDGNNIHYGLALSTAGQSLGGDSAVVAAGMPFYYENQWSLEGKDKDDAVLQYINDYVARTTIPVDVSEPHMDRAMLAHTSSNAASDSLGDDPYDIVYIVNPDLKISAQKLPGKHFGWMLMDFVSNKNEDRAIQPSVIWKTNFPSNLNYKKVTYELNGGTLDGQTEVAKYILAGMAAPMVDQPTKDRNHFVGWFTDEACTQEYKSNVKLTEDTTLYAGWIPTICQVTYNLNGGTSAGQKEIVHTVKYLETAPEIDRPLKKDYAFDGFYSDKELKNLFDFTTPITEDTTLYAKWTPVTSYVLVTYDFNGGTCAGHSELESYIKKGEAAPEIYRPLKEGYAFDGFYTDAALTQKYEKTPLNTNTTLYTKWTDLEQYHLLTFELNGGTSAGLSRVITYVKDGEAAPEIPRPMKAQNAFDGFYTDEALTEKYEGAGLYTDTTLYVKWTDVAGFREVRYVLNGGCVGGETEIVTYVRDGEPAPVNFRPHKKEYAFDGFYTDEELVNKYEGTPITEPTTLYAKWQSITDYVLIIYELNGGMAAGESYIETYVRKGDPAPKIYRPVRKGYAFDGFYTDEDLTYRYIDGTPIYGDTTLYTKWTDITGYRVVTYELNGGISSGLSEIVTYVKDG